MYESEDDESIEYRRWKRWMGGAVERESEIELGRWAKKVESEGESWGSRRCSLSCEGCSFRLAVRGTWL